MFRRLLRSISAHGVFIIVVASIFFDSWLLFQGWNSWADQPLENSQITAQQLRVNDAPRNLFLKNIDQYQKPSAPLANAQIIFQAQTPN